MKRRTLLLSSITSSLTLPAFAQEPKPQTNVALAGSIGGRALLVINGGTPRAVAVGQTIEGVKLVSFDGGERAVLEADGKRFTVEVGTAAVSGGQSDSGIVVLAPDSRGHFNVSARINERATGRFLVDTGATNVLLTRQDAEAAGIRYKEGPRSVAQTANGLAYFHSVRLNSLRIGNLSISGIDAAVSDNPLPFGLLGMSFLNRVEMKREGDQLTLKKRF
jgi:aspartyl protease family protein